jgi:hypothetical protein
MQARTARGEIKFNQVHRSSFDSFSPGACAKRCLKPKRYCIQHDTYGRSVGSQAHVTQELRGIGSSETLLWAVAILSKPVIDRATELLPFASAPESSVGGAND